jgi:hypothetical protein
VVFSSRPIVGNHPDMICPHLKSTIDPICQAKNGTLMALTAYEFEYSCLTFRYKECAIYKEYHPEGGPMRYSGAERRKHERFKAPIPVNIGLINLKGEKTIEAQFKGMTMDVSMEGLSLELKYPGAERFPFGNRILGESREFDLEITAKMGQPSFSCVGEVRWASILAPSMMKMGIFLKEIIQGETGKWRDFVMTRNTGTSRVA